MACGGEGLKEGRSILVEGELKSGLFVVKWGKISKKGG